MMQKILFKKIIVFIFCCFFAGGCASSRPRISSKMPFRRQGIYHKIEKGETLWAVSRKYGINIHEIIMANKIPNAAKIEIGQLIFIPYAKVKNIPILNDTKKGDDNNFIWPAKGKINSYFGKHNKFGSNQGLDIEPSSQKNVLASRSGDVVFADYLSGYGYSIILDHGDGYFTSYSNNSQLFVSVGQHVSKGSVIAKLGKNNKNLHFEIRKNTVAQNPLYFLP